jgi:hypothetical protein
MSGAMGHAATARQIALSETAAPITKSAGHMLVR